MAGRPENQARRRRTRNFLSSFIFFHFIPTRDGDLLPVLPEAGPQYDDLQAEGLILLTGNSIARRICMVRKGSIVGTVGLYSGGDHLRATSDVRDFAGFSQDRFPPGPTCPDMAGVI